MIFLSFFLWTLNTESTIKWDEIEIEIEIEIEVLDQIEEETIIKILI